MKRLSDWHSRFVAAMEEARRTPFAWGEHDCGADWAGRAVEAITGTNPAPKSLCRYKTARGALGAMKRAGADNLADLVANYLPEIHPSRAVMGDIAAVKVDGPFSYALGVVNGPTILVRGPEGMRVVDLLEVDRAFAVGERLTT